MHRSPIGSGHDLAIEELPAGRGRRSITRLRVELAEVVAAGTFFDTYSLDSDERFWVNEVATYFEILATLWKDEIVDPELAENWLGARFYWERMGPVLVQAREIFGSDELWTDFEALARAHMDR